MLCCKGETIILTYPAGATASAWKSGSRYGPISGRQALGATVSAQGAALPPETGGGRQELLSRYFALTASPGEQRVHRRSRPHNLHRGLHVTHRQKCALFFYLYAGVERRSAGLQRVGGALRWRCCTTRRLDDASTASCRDGRGRSCGCRELDACPSQHQHWHRP